MANAPLPQRRLPVLGGDGNFVLPWYRWLQNLGTATGAQGPPGPAGPTGPTGPAGADQSEALTLLGLAPLDGSAGVIKINSTTADLTVGGNFSYPSLTIVSAPKWDTARTLSFTGDATGSNTVDGSSNVATALTLATVNTNTGTWGDSTHVGQFTVNGKGLITAAGSVAIASLVPGAFTGTVSTTTATPTTIATVPVASNSAGLITADVAGWRTGGSAGSTGDSGGFRFQTVVKNIAGTVTIVNQGVVYGASDQGTWTVSATVSGTNILIQVTGATNNNVDWALSGQEVTAS